jgi:hypothetical protein
VDTFADKEWEATVRVAAGAEDPGRSTAPETGLSLLTGLIGLGRRDSKDRLEAAAQRDVHLMMNHQTLDKLYALRWFGLA